MNYGWNLTEIQEPVIAKQEVRKVEVSILLLSQFRNSIGYWISPHLGSAFLLTYRLYQLFF